MTKPFSHMEDNILYSIRGKRTPEEFRAAIEHHLKTYKAHIVRGESRRATVEGKKGGPS